MTLFFFSKQFNTIYQFCSKQVLYQHTIPTFFILFSLFYTEADFMLPYLAENRKWNLVRTSKDTVFQINSIQTQNHKANQTWLFCETLHTQMQKKDTVTSNTQLTVCLNMTNSLSSTLYRPFIFPSIYLWYNFISDLVANRNIIQPMSQITLSHYAVRMCLVSEGRFLSNGTGSRRQIMTSNTGHMELLQ